MKPRELSLLIVLLAIAGGALIVLGGPDRSPQPVPDERPGEVVTDPRLPAIPRASESRPDPTVPRDVETIPTESERPVHEIPADAEHGFIDGELILRGSLRDLITDYTILVEELHHDPNSLKKGFQYRHVYRINPDGPQWFSVDDVPFSTRGFRVTALAQGMNGSSTIVQVNRQNPVAQVALPLIQAGPFTLRLTDQFNNPLTGIPVELRPMQPYGRRVEFAETDGYGSAVFDVLVAGDYEVWVDQQLRETISVAPGLSNGNPLRAAAGSTLLQIPLGSSLKVELADRYRNPVVGATVILQKIDTQDLRDAQLESDSLGHALFEHLEPGPYRIRVQGDGLLPRIRRIDVAASDEAALETQTIQIRVDRR